MLNYQRVTTLKTHIPWPKSCSAPGLILKEALRSQLPKGCAEEKRNQPGLFLVKWGTRNPVVATSGLKTCENICIISIYIYNIWI